MRSTNSKIGRNAFFLYMRTILIMGISIFSSRIVLDKLGVEDFGIYNLLAGVIALFTAFRGAFSTAVQRFVNFSIGENDNVKTKDYFNISVFIYIFVGLLFVLLAESIGVWLVKTQLNIPIGKGEIAFWVYQISVVSIFISIINVPFDALILAYQKMDFYAITSIIEALFRLLALFLLSFLLMDKLIAYALLLLGGNLIIRICYVVYSRSKFEICRFSLSFNWGYMKGLVSFAGWNTMGIMTFTLVNQGVNLLFNSFGGVLLNASQGIASQVQSAIMNLVNNIVLAFKPRIIELYAQNRTKEFYEMILFCSKSNIIMFLVLAIPIYLFLDFILSLWLNIIPEYTIIFIYMIIPYLLIRVFHNPIELIFISVGDLKKYQMIEFVILILTLPLSYLFLYLKFEYYYVYVIMGLVELINLISICFYAKHRFDFPFNKWLINIFLPVFIPFLILIIVSSKLEQFNGKLLLLLISYLYIVYIYMNKNERAIISKLLVKKIIRR